MAAPFQHSRKASLLKSQSGFDFTTHIQRICEDMVSRLPQLAHIDMQYVAVRFCQTRKNVPHGLQASLTPMRFKGGERDLLKKNEQWQVQQIRDQQGREMLYLLSFYMPRFQNLSFSEKLITILHELWHISPDFDGDLRRLAGRCYVHSNSEKMYDAAMSVLADQWLAKKPPAAIYNFLKLSFFELHTQHGGVWGLQIATPKLIRTR